MALEIVKSEMANALTSADSNHVIAVTEDVYDESQNKYQSAINAQVIQDIENLKKSGGGGGGDINLSDYAKKEYVDDEVQKAKDYTDEQIGNIDIPTALSELSDDADHRLVTDVEKQKWDNKSDFSGDYNDLANKPDIPDVSNFETKDVVAQNLVEAKEYTDTKTAVLATKEEVENVFTEFEGVVEQGVNTKQDKTAIVTATNNTVSVDKRSKINVNGDVVISLEPYEDDGYVHSYEIVLNVGYTTYPVSFPDNIKWVKDLEIVFNSRYYIIIEDNVAMWVSVAK